MSAVIETEKLTKTYGKIRGIRDVDLTVNEGEVFGFLGPNGAGKTTTIRTLLGFLRPSGGRAWVFGMDARMRSVDIRKRVGNLPGVRDLKVDGATLSFTLYDNLDGVVKLAARNRLVNMGYERPSLEEVFLTYYGGHENGGSS